MGVVLRASSTTDAFRVWGQGRGADSRRKDAADKDALATGGDGTKVSVIRANFGFGKFHIAISFSSPRLFEDPCDALLSPAARRVKHLWENILQPHDPALYEHLQSLGIVPATFATNWTKLLFSRQFPSDFLLLWDGAVAAGFLDFVDHSVVAMVWAVRGALLDGDCIRCNSILVSKYPRSVEARSVLRRAIQMRRPQHDQRKSGRSPLKGLSSLLSSSSDGNGGSKLLQNLKDIASGGSVPMGKKIGATSTEGRKMVDLTGKGVYPLAAGGSLVEFPPNCREFIATAPNCSRRWGRGGL